LEAAILYYPLEECLPPESFDELDNALRQWQSGKVAWLLMPSPFAVDAVADRLDVLTLKRDTRVKSNFAFFGALTQLAAKQRLPIGETDLAISTSHADLVLAMQLNDESNVAIALAEHSRTDWPHRFAAVGAKASVVPAYRLRLAHGGDDLPGALWGGLVDAIIFLTEESVRHFSTRLKAEGGTLDMLKHVVVCCLDAPTVAAARAFGLHIHVSPSDQTIPTLVEHLAKLLNSKSPAA
jgi:uroporphyrinogen-III synthase